MDDELKRKIAASLDTASDAAADPEITRVLERDPIARDFARGLYALDRALKSWPARARSESEWEKLAAAIDTRIAAAARDNAKVRKGGEVSRKDPDPAAFPEFEEPTPKMESKQVMSDANENDAELENLAALTRTSLGPGVISAAPRVVAPSITDEVDDTSSGIVDIKKLAEVARNAASMPPAATVSTPPATESPSPAKEAPVAAAKVEAPKTDVMVSPPTRVSPVAQTVPPKKGFGAMWGLVGGLTMSAAAFMIYQSQGTGSMNSPAVEQSETAAAPMPVAPPQPAPTAANGAVTESAPVAPAAPAVQAVAAPTPSMMPAPEAAPPPAEAQEAATTMDTDGAGAPGAHRREAERRGAPRVAAARPAAHAVAEAPAAPTPTAAPAPPPPTVAVARAPGTPAATPTAPRDNSINALLNQVAPGPANAPAAQGTAAPTQELPERLTRPQMVAVMTPLNSAVRACMQGATGTVPVALVIGNDGVVRSARVSGEHGGDDVGSCVSNVVQRAHFPSFRAAQANVVWPFVILPPH